MAIRIAHTRSGPIEYRRAGAGPAVLLLNGGHCSRHTRLSHEQLAGAGFTVVTPSRPGYDATPASVGRTAQAAADALAALLDALHCSSVAVIGISAAGPTAIAFAQQHPGRTRKLILESAITLPWDPIVKRGARLVFGPAERLTWSLLKLALRVRPAAMTKLMLGEISTLDVAQVWQRLTPGDIRFVQQMLMSMRSGTGFVCDIEHMVDRLDTIRAPVLVMYSPHDKSVPPSHAQRVGRDVAQCELHEVPADTHLLWIGACADHVWRKRLSFLSEPDP